MQMSDLNDLDKKILTLLRHNARMSYTDIGKEVGLSRVAVKKRMDSMEKRGVIVSYDTVISCPKKFKFFLDITATEEVYDSVLNKLKNQEILCEVYTTTGEWRIHCVGVASNANEIKSFVNTFHAETIGLRKVECHVALSNEKN